jgi:hypothetical protein
MKIYKITELAYNSVEGYFADAYFCKENYLHDFLENIKEGLIDFLTNRYKCERKEVEEEIEITKSSDVMVVRYGERFEWVYQWEDLEDDYIEAMKAVFADDIVS